MKSKLKSIVMLVLCIALLIPAARVDAGTSVKQQAQEPVKKFYKYAKNLEMKKMSWYVAKKSKDDSKNDFTSSQTKKFYGVMKKENKKKFSYKILNTTLSKDKKSATLTVKVTYRSLYRAGYYSMEKTYKKILDYYYDHGRMPGSSKVNGWLVKYLERGAKKYRAKPTSRTVKIRTRKYGSKWKIVENTDQMMHTYSCNILIGMEYASNDL